MQTFYRKKKKKEALSCLSCSLGVSFLSPILSFAGMNNTTLFLLSCDLKVCVLFLVSWFLYKF